LKIESDIKRKEKAEKATELVERDWSSIKKCTERNEVASRQEKKRD